LLTLPPPPPIIAAVDTDEFADDLLFILFLFCGRKLLLHWAGKIFEAQRGGAGGVGGFNKEEEARKAVDCFFSFSKTKKVINLTCLWASS
jgi:hypothetical protein